MSYNELQKKIVQARKKHFPNDLVSPASIRERMIVVDTRKNPNSISATNLSFIGATKSNTKFLTAENKDLEKNLHVSRKDVEQLHATTQNPTSTQVDVEEMKAMIVSEVSTLGETMLNLYEELVSMHREFFHAHGLQKQCKYFFKVLMNMQVSITSVHEWSMRYKGALLDLGKKMK